ncbi:MAG: ParB/RepB/Spo0J family partition protein [Flavobacteriales bacterium]|nr:ParB/RepB/Spo0J family partition protein [Flavobacteriales bacterium]
MAKRQALGRGLSALLENSGQVERKTPVIDQPTIGHVAGPIAMLSIGQIEANPFQPRTTFDQEALSELAHSIETHGIIQPITVRKVGASRFQLISGERRFRASQLAGLEEIPAYIRSADDQAMLEMALVENIQRENLDPIEVAISYQRLIEECDLTQEQLSVKVGKSRSAVTNFLRLLKLPAEVQVGLIERKITMGHARALVNAGNESVIINLYRRILKEDLSVRRVEELVRGTNEVPARKPASRTDLSLELQKAQAELRLRYGKGTSIRRSQEGKGKIELTFQTDQDLEDLLRLLNP